MHQTIKKLLIPVCSILLALGGCKGPEKAETQEQKQEAGTPVTVTSVATGSLAEYIDLNATATFLQKSYAKANVNGYVQAVHAAPGKYVHAGEVLFVIKTKEAQSLDDAVNKLDPGFKFSGVNNIKAATGGYITQLNHQAGDYVQDGEQLAVISDESSFAFILNLPYELKKYLPDNPSVMLTLPDGSQLKGAVASSMPVVDAASQTLNVVIKVPGVARLPENLIARARIIKSNKVGAQSLPKAAILTNDVQDDFWVMKMIDSVTAVKVSIKKGMETADRVEVLEPLFNAGDKILVTGNFGLPDTAKVHLEQ